MKKHPLFARFAAPAAAAALSLGIAWPAQAQNTEPWRFELSLYGWFPGISGTSGFPASRGGASADVSMGDVLDALEFAFFGTFEARQGRWGIWTDLAYADLGASHGTTLTFRPLPAIEVKVKADADLDVKTWIWTTAGLYRLKDDHEGTMDLLFGARLLDMDNTLSWSAAAPGPNTRSGRMQVAESYWDAIVGLKGRALLGEERKWFLPFYVDVGTGQSRLTWQINAGLGYAFDWGSVLATWRYMDYAFKASSHVQDLSFNGPTLGVVFKF